MDVTEKRCLDCHARFLQNNLVLTEEFYGGLIEYQVLTDAMIDRIRSKNTLGGQIMCLIQTLKKRGPLAFKHFVSVLNETGQSHIGDKLEMNLKRERQGSGHLTIKENIKRFLHKNFIHNRHFTLDNEKLLLDHFIMKEDWEEERKGRKEALERNTHLAVELQQREQEVSDLNRRLNHSLAQYQTQAQNIQELEMEKDELMKHIDDLEAIIRNRDHRVDMTVDDMDGAVPSEPDDSSSAVTDNTVTSMKDHSEIKEQEEALHKTQRQLDSLKERTRISNCKLRGMTDKVKAFLRNNQCSLDQLGNMHFNNEIKQLEAHIEILMNQFKTVQQDKSNQTKIPDMVPLQLKDKLDQTRKQKCQLRMELQSVQRRLKTISCELENEKKRVHQLEAHLQSREQSRETSVHSEGSRIKTPVTVNFPYIYGCQSSQNSMLAHQSMPEYSLSFPKKSQDQKTSKKLGTILRMQCSRCDEPFKLGQKQGCSYHPENYIHHGRDGQQARWPCCGQTSEVAPGCRKGHHIVNV